MAADSESEGRLDGLLLRLAEEHSDGGISSVKSAIAVRGLPACMH